GHARPHVVVVTPRLIGCNVAVAPSLARRAGQRAAAASDCVGPGWVYRFLVGPPTDPPRSTRSARSLRMVAQLAVASGVGVVMSIAILVVVSGWLLREATDEVLRDTQTLDVVERLEGNLLYFVQVSNIHVADPTPTTAEMRQTMRARVDELEAALEALAGSPDELEAARGARQQIDRFFTVRMAAEASDDALRDIVRRSTQALDEALASVDHLRVINQRQLEASETRAVRLRRMSTGAGAGAVLVVLAGVIGFVLFLR